MRVTIAHLYRGARFMREMSMTIVTPVVSMPIDGRRVDFHIDPNMSHGSVVVYRTADDMSDFATDEEVR